MQENQTKTISGELMNKLVRDPEVAQSLVKKITELGLGEKLDQLG